QGIHLKRASKVNMKPAPSLTQAPKGTQRKDNAAHASLPPPIHLSKSKTETGRTDLARREPDLISVPVWKQKDAGAEQVGGVS
ncbi:hypothetical protein, partial [Salinarimonas soli]|uniref:hypothetical protein n=1 Tax=Salinarimonas soli TaxID=1638099 RepID=UPI001AED899A